MKADVMGKWAKRIVGIFLIAFVLYFVITYPHQSAGALNTFFEAIRQGAVRVAGFFVHLG
ncbi:MAG: hypothetical protein FWF25_04590 [Propionibacteriaceae bacterium]|nr:hypothetical protein [Propionibacteriaceae bacterium]